MKAPEITIMLDRPRTLRMDFAALEAAEERLTELAGHPVSMFEIMGSGDDLQRLRNLRVLIWGLLRHEDPDLSDAEVGRWLHFGNIGAVFDAIVRLKAGSLPDPEPATNGQPEDLPLDPPPPAPASIGSASGPSAEWTSASATPNSGA